MPTNLGKMEVKHHDDYSHIIHKSPGNHGPCHGKTEEMVGGLRIDN